MDSNWRWIWVAAAAAIVGAMVFVLSPWWSIASLTQALQAGDRQRVALYVDFPRVKESLSAQLKAAMTDAIEKEGKDDPSSTLGAMLGTVIIDRAVDAYVTPDGLVRLMKKSLVEPEAASEKKKTSHFDAARRAWDRVDLEWLSPREIRFRVHDEGSPQSFTALLERDGLRWRIVDLEIPALNPETM